MDASGHGHDGREQDATGGLDEIAGRDSIRRYDTGPRIRHHQYHAQAQVSTVLRFSTMPFPKSRVECLLLMSIAEFTVHRSWQSNRRSPLRWLWSYVRRNPIWILAMLIGAFGNAVLASVVPLEAGRAFNALQTNPNNTQALLLAAVIIAVSQIIRGLLQLVRNFSTQAHFKHLFQPTLAAKNRS